MIKKFVKVLAFVAVAACVGLLAYRWFFLPADDQQTRLRNIAAGLVARTLPPDAMLVGEVKTIREPMAIRAEWELETAQEWEPYVSRLTEKFLEDFTNKRLGDAEILFLKQLPGDVYRVSVKRISEKPLRVRVMFVGYPS